MGAAKRKRIQLCICGSHKSASECCLSFGRWHKKPAVVSLRTSRTINAIENCYLSHLQSCESPMSGEHLISKSVISLLARGKGIEVSGLSWMPEGTSKFIGINSFTAKCLCKGHNSRLGTLDDAAAFFFSSLLASYENETESRRFVVSGHDLERWLLKTIKAMAISGSLSDHSGPLTDQFAADLDIASLLEGDQTWHSGMGLYFLRTDPNIAASNDKIGLWPWLNQNRRIEGAILNALGINFSILLRPRILNEDKHYRGNLYRPGAIKIDHPKAKHVIGISWDDSLAHSKMIVVKPLAPVGDDV